MTPDEISVRQWQELYRAGVFEKDNEQTRELAGWGEVDDPLNNWRMKKLSRLVLAVTHPFILDNYRVFFSVGQPSMGHKHGFVCFYPLEEEHFQCLFHIDMDYPYAREKWALSTRRYGEGETEFECGHVRDMLRYIHVMADELELGVKPPFWPEKEAAQQYAFEYIPLCGYTIPRREGEHSYSVWDRVTDSRIILRVARTPGDAPPGFQAQDAVPVCGLYVFPQKGVGRAAETPMINRKKTHKKKEAER